MATLSAKPVSGLRRDGRLAVRSWFAIGIAIAFAVALTFLTLPVVAIFVDTSPRELLASLDDPVARDALWLSLKTTSISIVLILLVGTPAAYFLATALPWACDCHHPDRAATRATTGCRGHRAGPPSAPRASSAER